MNKTQELFEEFRSVFSGKGTRVLDSFIPLLVFLIANVFFGFTLALWGSLSVSLFFTVYRLFQKKSLVYALGGLGGVILAALFVNISGSEVGYFLPGLISGAITVILCIISVVLNRPLVAWTSYIARRWSLNWYWHPRILPAYNEVTIIWAVAFSFRLGLEYRLFHQDAVDALGLSRILLGWPFTIMLLIVSYLYGLWRLGRLNGPSVEEFKTGKMPPWEGQKRGF